MCKRRVFATITVQNISFSNADSKKEDTVLQHRKIANKK